MEPASKRAASVQPERGTKPNLSPFQIELVERLGLTIVDMEKDIIDKVMVKIEDTTKDSQVFLLHHKLFNPCGILFTGQLNKIA